MDDVKGVMGGFIDGMKKNCFDEAEALIGELSLREKKVLELGFANGMLTANKASELIERVFGKGLSHV